MKTTVETKNTRTKKNSSPTTARVVDLSPHMQMIPPLSSLQIHGMKLRKR